MTAKRKPQKKTKASRWGAGQHPVTWPGEPFKVEVLAAHPQMVCLVFRREAFAASGYLSLADLRALHARLGELIAPFEESLAALERPMTGAEHLAWADRSIAPLSDEDFDEFIADLEEGSSS